MAARCGNSATRADAATQEKTIEADPSGNRKMWNQALGLLPLGSLFGAAVVVGYLGGAWADRRLHTTPWLSILGLLLGIAAAFMELLRVVGRQRRRMQEEARRESQSARQKKDTSQP
jgi:F0F1-type ATP synthase assembly protein I